MRSTAVTEVNSIEKSVSDPLECVPRLFTMGDV